MDSLMKRIAIVVIGYNRLDSLKRLLFFLGKANYPKADVSLIISLDYCNDSSIKTYADNFLWNYGEKRVCYSEVHLGLRKHVLQCGNYLNRYNFDAIIVFEDDIMPAYDFYTYALKAVDRFGEDENIAGIALYSHRCNPNGRQAFQPAYSQYDNFFMQYACSWGQIWTKKQWNEFYCWYEEHREDLFESTVLPANVCSWPNSSWLKFHIKYCVETNKYFVYPYVALATNFNEKGTHVGRTENSFQIPILAGEKKNYNFGMLDQAIRYDAFFERMGLATELGLSENELCVDLFGNQAEHRNCRYWLTSAKADYEIKKQFGKVLKISEENVLYGINGEDIFLYDTLVTKDNNWNNVECMPGLRKAGQKQMVLAGAGSYGKLWLERFKRENIEVLCFADGDTNKVGHDVYGKRVISYNEVKKIKDKIIIFVTVADRKVRNELEMMLVTLGLGRQIVGSPLHEDCTISETSNIYGSFLEGKNLLLQGAELVNSYLGRCSYLSANAKIRNAKVGRYTCIGPQTEIIFGQHPTRDFVSVHPAFYSTQNEIGYSYVQKEKFHERRYANEDYAVLIGNDVWIGMGAKIMEGVTIADGTIVAAGAVVVKDTEPYEMVGGVPACHIKYRFEKEQRDRLMKIQWWNKEEAWIQAHAEEFEDIKMICEYV